jgi:ABC-type cobalamin/Fe3+-siderophores transport system ATPase subunit
MLQATDVWFGYDDLAPVLRGVSVAIPHDRILGILGPNGSGKTTLLRMLAGTRQPQHGSVTLDGLALGSLSRGELARRMAVVPQETQLAFDYSVAEVAMMGRYPHLGPFEIEGPGDLAVVEQTLASTGTVHLKDRLFSTLSGGEKQRVVIAAALAQIFRLKAEATKIESGSRQASPGTREASPGTREALPDSREAPPDSRQAPPDSRGAPPDSRSFSLQAEDTGYLLLDEPTASLDLAYQVEVAALLRRLHRERGVAVVISTHDLGLAGTLCDQLMLIRDGTVVATGATEDVLTPGNVRDLYGIDAEVIAHPSGYRMVVPLHHAGERDHS